MLIETTDLDGKIKQWKLDTTKKKDHKNISNLHLTARLLLNEIYPTRIILEEITIHPKQNIVLYLDFYIPSYKLAIEVHGKQHYKFLHYYHPNILSYFEQNKRDRIKRIWCVTNGICLIELPHDDTKNWKDRILNRDY